MSTLVWLGTAFLSRREDCVVFGVSVICHSLRIVVGAPARSPRCQFAGSHGTFIEVRARGWSVASTKVCRQREAGCTVGFWEPARHPSPRFPTQSPRPTFRLRRRPAVERASRDLACIPACSQTFGFVPSHSVRSVRASDVIPRWCDKRIGCILALPLPVSNGSSRLLQRDIVRD